ncbi:MAG: SAM-dependent methyltransferase [Bacteroidales bacterium]|nr:SAM-dependent methyltransferase [Bacteroidales bacterium]
MKSVLYLIPSSLGAGDVDIYLPPAVVKVLHRLDIFFAENIRTARRFIKSTGYGEDISSLTFFELSEHTSDRETEVLLKILQEKGEAGMISEAGLPGVADPGGTLVRLCHRHGIRVVPLTGPSSVFLALMASGLNGQCFSFHGYLPKERAARIRKLRDLEREAHRTGASQIFMETPYRNNHLLQDMLATCHDNTLLCIAADLTTEREFIRTQSISDWKKNVPDLHKRPAMFILGGT